MENSTSGGDEDELPQIFDDPRGKLDVAGDIVDGALEKAPANAIPSSATRWVALAADRVEHGDIDDAEWKLAVGATERVLRERTEN